MAFGFSNFSKSRPSPIAIDFGADSLKVLQVIPSDPPQLVAAARAVLPDEARKDPAARADFLSESLRDLLRRQPFKGRRAMLSFPAFQTLMQHIEIGRTDGDDVEAAIGDQLRARLSIEPSRMVIRHFPVRQMVRDGVTMQEVICLAAAREVVMGYVDIARRCKLDVVGMHSEPIAVLKAFSHLYRREEDKHRAACFIDIGAAMTKVVIAHGPRMVFGKSIHAAGDGITRQIAKARAVDFMEAYRLRVAEAAWGDGIGAPAPVGVSSLTAGATGMADPAASGTGAPAGGMTTPEAAVDTLDCIVDELRLSLRYHANLFPETTIEKLVFLGGEARHVSSCQTVARAMRMAAQVGDPFARMMRIGAAKTAHDVDLNEPQPGWAVAMGLCLSEANL